MDCEVLMFQPVRLIPLTDNTWIYVAPAPERLTVLCKGQNPTDIEIKDNGVLTFLSDCIGYGNNVMIKPFIVHSVNNTGKDTNHPLSLPLDCCQVTIDTLPLGDIKLEIPKGISTHDGDLHLAKHKVDTVKKIVDEQEWKAKDAAGKKVVIVYDWDYGSCSIFVFFLLLLLLLMPLL
jgi:hypothetical protein